MTERCDLIYLPKDRLGLGEPTSLEGARASVGKVWGGEASEEVTAVLGAHYLTEKFAQVRSL